MNWTQRVHQLLEQLEKQARQCPGLYPVQSSDDFVRIVRDHLDQGDPAAALAISPEETATWLEQIWRNPEISYQLNAQSLIRRGASPFRTVADNPALKRAVG